MKKMQRKGKIVSNDELDLHWNKREYFENESMASRCFAYLKSLEIYRSFLPALIEKPTSIDEVIRL